MAKVKETGRRCTRCGYAWYATPPKGKPKKPRWHDERSWLTTSNEARMTRRVSNYELAEQAQRLWDRCANCGSGKIKSDTSRGFTPTGAVVPTKVMGSPPPPTPVYVFSPPSVDQEPLSPHLGPAPPVLKRARVQRNAPPPIPPITRPGPESPSPVWAALKAFYLRHWRIIWAVIFLVAPFGSIGNPDTYSGPLWLNVLKFISILIGCWLVASFFLSLHLRRPPRHEVPAMER